MGRYTFTINEFPLQKSIQIVDGDKLFRRNGFFEIMKNEKIVAMIREDIVQSVICSY